MKKLSVVQWIGLGFSIIGTICGVIFLIAIFKPANGGGKDLSFMCVPAVLCAIISYILCGGLGYTIKAAFGVAKTMWRVIPAFPIDLLLGIVGFIFGFFFLLFVPVFFAIKSIKAKQSQAPLE